MRQDDAPRKVIDYASPSKGDAGPSIFEWIQVVAFTLEAICIYLLPGVSGVHPVNGANIITIIASVTAALFAVVLAARKSSRLGAKTGCLIALHTAYVVAMGVLVLFGIWASRQPIPHNPGGGFF